MSNERQQTVSSRDEQLKEAWGLGVQGYYGAALEMLDELVQKDPSDVRALRLKGNLLELKEMDLLENSGRRLASSVDYVAARECYEKILQLEPENIKANIDLGDHYRNLDANDKALEYYKETMRIMKHASRDEAWRENAQELLDATALLTKHERLAADARSIEAWCKRALSTLE